MEVELDLAPAAAQAPEEPGVPEIPAPTIKGFADLLLDRLPGKVLVVRKAPVGDGILVVVAGAPAELRPAVETVLSEHYVDTLPALHLMEQEGYQSLLAFLPPAARPEDEVFHAAALPKASPSGRDLFEARRKKANEGLAFAEKRLALAEVVLKGGFPEEMLRPIREALGWGLTSLLALHHDFDPAADLPSPRRIHADLVEPGHLPDDVAARLSRVRELTAPPEPGDEAPPPSLQTGETLAAAVRDLVTLAREQVVKVGL